MSPLETIVEHLRDGEVVGFPTDTVYGCGVSVRDASSASLVNEFKRRDPNKPVAWLIASKEEVEVYAKNVPDYVEELMATGWPGAMTLIFEASENVPLSFLCGLDTIALRLPNCACVRKVITSLGCPIAASSANYTGEKPPRFLEDVKSGFMDNLGYALTCLHGQCKDASGIPSTIIDCTGDVPVTLR